jgi:hypothetical protein
MKLHAALLAVTALALGVSCPAQGNHPQAASTVSLNVALPNPAQKLLYVHEIVPVAPGPLTLYYPKWIPGDH